jgi:NTP pyrophosphatase (non-canonical NTP hydrolase)
VTESLKQYGADLATLCDIIHTRNSTAGWWTDLKTGVSILETRNRPELLMLVVSEVSEADGGHEDGLNDDKLPHLPMFDVELADVAIRLFDIIGAENALYGSPIAFNYHEAIRKARVRFYLDGASHERRLLRIINEVSAAMEHRRKSRTEQYREKVSDALAMTFAVAIETGIDLLDVIDQKVAFNANRADHKIENRLKDDGKKF